MGDMADNYNDPSVINYTYDLWTMRDGRQILVREMKESHIRNTIRYLFRRGYVAASTVNFYLNCTLPQGDMAQDAFDAEFDTLLERPVTKWIDVFNAELQRRGLKEEKGVPVAFDNEEWLGS